MKPFNVARAQARKTLATAIDDARKLSSHPDGAAQLQLKFMYQAMRDSGETMPSVSDVGFKAFSQADEDGILLFIFSVLGTHSKRSVEICAGEGIECNTANLIINHGWHGLLVDGDEALVERGRAFYREHPSTYVFPPDFLCAWITRDNINDLLRRNGVEGEIDLLSIDMDGVDYWIWDSIEVIDPRVVVVEYQDILGPDRSLTVPYSDNFRSLGHGVHASDFYGASLPAFVKLAASRDYRLVGCNRYGYNAFFIKNPLGVDEIPEVPIEDCFVHPKVSRGISERLPSVQGLPWVEV